MPNLASLNALQVPTDRIWQTFQDKLYSPRPNSSVIYMRCILYGFFLWKLLSRDFTIFANVDPRVLDVYPNVSFVGLPLSYDLLASPWLIDLTTLHFIHWFVPHPDSFIFSLIYFSCIALAVANIILGSGPRNVFAIAFFVLVNYLWGYVWRTGANVDAIYVQLQMALVFALFAGWNGPMWADRKTLNARTATAGWLFSMLMLVLICYYFLSGLNKVVDLSIVQWFTYDLVGQLERRGLAGELGAPRLFHPAALAVLGNYSLLASLFVPMVYISHFLTVLMFFYRSQISKFMYFYWSFHLVSTGLGIYFSGLMLIWLIFFPAHWLWEKVSVQTVGSARRPRILEKLDWFGRIQFDEAPPESSQKTSINGSDVVRGPQAIRRIAWSLPLLWPLLPIIYLPFVSNLLWYILERTTATFAIASVGEA